MYCSKKCSDTLECYTESILSDLSLICSIFEHEPFNFVFYMSVQHFPSLRKNLTVARTDKIINFFLCLIQYSLQEKGLYITYRDRIHTLCSSCACDTTLGHQALTHYICHMAPNQDNETNFINMNS